MVDILHRVGVKAPSTDAVYGALTTVEGLSGWWTTDTASDAGDDSAVGDTIRFRFDAGGFDMEVEELVPGRKVRWLVVDGPEEWIGTHVDWDLEQVDEHTVVRFTHEGWREPVDFLRHCSTKWASFLLSLKSLVETGAGAPAPDDVKIDNWN